MENYGIDASRNPVVTFNDGEAMADSRDVAAYFGKQHKHVLEAFRNLNCSDHFRRSNFRPIEINDLTGPSTSHVMMTKNGFMFLVMGFTGAKAARLKEGYIGQFDAMESELLHRRTGIGSDAGPELLADYSARVHGDVVESRELMLAGVDNSKRAVMHHINSFVRSPLDSLRRYMDDWRTANQKQAKILLGAIDAQRVGIVRLEAATAPILRLARRAVEPETLIPSEWVGVTGVYRLAGVADGIRHQRSLSARVQRALDSFCIETYRQADIRNAGFGRKERIWRITAARAWLKASGHQMIAMHVAKYAPVEQGIIQFPSPSGAK